MVDLRIILCGTSDDYSVIFSVVPENTELPGSFWAAR